MRHACHRPRTGSTAACPPARQVAAFLQHPGHRRIRDDLQCNVREGNACHPAATLKIRKLTRSAGRIAEKPGSQGKADAGPNWEIAAQNWSLLQSQLKCKAARAVEKWRK